MARSLQRTISDKDWAYLRSPSHKHVPLRERLMQVLQVSTEDTLPNRILADLYVGAMQQGLDFGFSDEQVSTLVGICRAVHTSAVAERHALEVSVKHCNALLLAHSIDRPPQSVAIFSLHDMRRAAEWFSASYFMHYSMYQYVFTPQVTLSFTAKDPRELIELPVPLPPLQDALEEAEHAAQQAAAAEKRAQEAAEAQAEGERQAEEARQAALREAYLAAVPLEIKEQVEAAVAKEVARVRAGVEQEHAGEVERLRTEIKAVKA